MTTASPAQLSSAQRREIVTLLGSIVLIAACGLVYELLIATVSSYLLGSSVTQFSICIGVFIGAMGLGSHLSQRIDSGLLSWFVFIELVLAGLGGASVALLFLSYPAGWVYHLVLYTILVGIGALVGLELPLLTRLLKRYGPLRTTIAQALSFDYLGALAGSLLFPLVLLPTLGLMRTAFLLGLLNTLVAVWNIRVFQEELRLARMWLAVCLILGAGLVAGFLFSLEVVSLLEGRLYEDQIIHAEQTPYQRIIITRWRDEVRLFLNGHLQFSSTDEYRYHEALVHPAMSLPPVVENVLILGGGDGLCVREMLKYSGVKTITLVDIDARMTELARTYPALVEVNRQALDDPRVRIINEDAFSFLQRSSELYEVILADLPDPSTDVLAKLYSVEMYKLVKRRLAHQGIFATQAGSPFVVRDAYWCIERSLSAAGLHTAPYRAYIPSFGEWGFILAGLAPPARERTEVRVPTRYLTTPLLREMFTLSKDVGPVPVQPSTLDQPRIVQYYVTGASRWVRARAPGE